MTLPPLLSRLLVRIGVARLVPGLQRRLDGGADFLRYYSDRLLGSPLAQLEQIAALAPDAPDVIDLAAGSPCLDVLPGPPPRVPADRRGWPDLAGLPELRGAVAARLLADSRLAYSPAEEVLITNGALGAVGVILDAFVNRGDAVVLPEPISPLYPLLARSRGARVRWVGTRVEEGRLRLRMDQLARKLPGARLLVLCSPANPTGAALPPEDAERIAWWAERHDALILSDEAFAPLCDGHASTAIFRPARTRTLTVCSVSKSHALAHLRVGWIAAHRHLTRPCLATAALRAPFVPTLSQLAAKQALDAGPAPVRAVRAAIDARRDHAFGRLRAMGLTLDRPTAGLFHWFAVPPAWRSGRAFAEALHADRRVRVLPGDLFGPSGKGFVRLSVAADDGRLEAGLDRLAEHLNEGEGRARRAA
jgi:aminotransferase